MRHLPATTWLSLAVDAILIVLSTLHLPSLSERAQAPFQAVDDGPAVLVTEILDPLACPDLAPGDQILSYDGRALPAAAAVEFLTNFHPINDSVSVTYRRADGPTVSAAVRTIPFFRVSYSIIIGSVALLTWFLGIYVLLARPHDFTAAVLHASMGSLAVVLVTAAEAITPNSKLGFAGSVLFFLSYLSIAATFYLFTTLFPKPRPGSLPRRITVLYVPAAILAVGLIITWWRAAAGRSVERFVDYDIWYDTLHLYVLLLVGAGIVNFIRSYKEASAYDERRKLQWVLWGLCIGPAPFLLLNLLPQLFRPTGLVHEEYTLAFLVLIPLSFVISVARYHLFDVEQVIQRTTAYAVVVTVLLGVYLGMVSVVASLVGQMAASAGGAILVALLFEPVRARVQRAVDKRFFRIRYSFREAQTRFMDEIRTCMDEESVARLTIRQSGAFIPTERNGVFALERPSCRLRLLAQSGFALRERTAVRLGQDSPVLELRHPVALEGVLEPGILHEPADAPMFARWAIALVIPMLSESSEVQGLLVSGPKKSGARFTPDDIELLTVFAGQAGLALNRIRLQKALFEEHAESRRLEELSEMKSDFVSYVSHELRTPLTSIKMFTQLLRSKGGKTDRKTEEYLRIIEGETDRLGRMVSTILDAARIDQGRRAYQLAAADLGQIAEKVMESMRYQLEMQEFEVRVQRPARPLMINADADAVADAIMNLIGNSIKYSADQKWLAVKVFRDSDQALCAVEDHGVGISPDALPHLFDKFYRDPKNSDRVQGVGIGLSVVKHVMDAHGGKIEVASTPGRGTRFTLCFPLLPTIPPATERGTTP